MQPCGACSQIVTPWKFHSFQSGELTWQFKFCLFSCIKISCKSLKPKLTLDHLIYFFFKNDSDVIIVLYFLKLFTFIYGKVLTVVCVSLYVEKWETYETATWRLYWAGASLTIPPCRWQFVRIFIVIISKCMGSTDMCQCAMQCRTENWFCN